jgi:hypothetical protein
MWISSHKANRRTYTRPPVCSFNPKCDAEISTVIDIVNNFPTLFCMCLLACSVLLFWFIEYHFLNNYALLCLSTVKEFCVLIPDKKTDN